MPIRTSMRWGLILFGALFATGLAAARADEGWSISRFDVRLEIEKSGALNVVETIEANFDESKHGIYREIPVLYDVNGQQKDIRILMDSVQDEKGTPWPHGTSYEGNKAVYKIGDAHKTIEGKHTYVLRYRVARTMLWEGENAVLRWNATGNEWRVPVGQATVTVVFPEPLDDKRVQYDAWTGIHGAKEKAFTKGRVDDRSVKFVTNRLDRGEGITVEIALPESVVPRPPLLRRLSWWLLDNCVYGLIPLGLAGCVGTWRLRGKDAEGRGAIVVNYDPPAGLGPAEVGTLIDEKVDLRDISSVLIDLAVRGHLTIRESTQHAALWGSSTDYTFTRKPHAGPLKPYESLIHKKLFDGRESVQLSDLKNTFYDVLPAIRKGLYQSLAQQGYFDGRPDRARMKYLILGVLAVAAMLAIAFGVQMATIGRVFPAPVIVTGIALLVMVIVTSRVMPRRTRKGRIAWEQVRGLEEYIRRAEVDDLKAQERQNIFERLLPYAAALNLTTRWTGAFEGLFQQPPDWYQPVSNGPFSMNYFGSSIDRSVGAMNTTFPSQPRTESGGGWSSGGSGGGGFSGGGFGGGGGGSW